jgi:hypothetical protein
MRISDLLRSLADMVASAEGGGPAPAPMAPQEPVRDFNPTNGDADAGTGVFVPPLQAKLEILKKSVGLDNVYDGQGDELDQMKKMAGLPHAVQQEAADDEPFDG